MKTTYIVQAYGGDTPFAHQAYAGRETAIKHAEQRAASAGGVLVALQEYDEDSGRIERLEVVRRIGTVPADFPGINLGRHAEAVRKTLWEYEQRRREAKRQHETSPTPETALSLARLVGAEDALIEVLERMGPRDSQP